MKHRRTAVFVTAGLMALALAGCSSNASSEPAASTASSASTEALCNQIKKAQTELTAITADLSSGDPAKQNQAISKLTEFYNKALAELPANQSAALSAAIADAKSSIGSGGNAANAQEGIDKVKAAVKKQCPNL